jgi:hypothetical protein
LWRLFGELHQFDLVSVGVVRPGLEVAVEAEEGFADYGRAVLAQTLDGRANVVGQQADVLEALYPVRELTTYRDLLKSR